MKRLSHVLLLSAGAVTLLIAQGNAQQTMAHVRLPDWRRLFRDLQRDRNQRI